MRATQVVLLRIIQPNTVMAGPARLCVHLFVGVQSTPAGHPYSPCCKREMVLTKFRHARDFSITTAIMDGRDKPGHDGII
jgi:hypothetical protein